jgi:hypothetical protein
MLLNKIYGIYIVSLVCLLGFPCEGFAYFGPGAGVSMLGALWGVIIAIIFTIAGIVLWPLRILLKRMKNKGNEEKGA